MSFVHNLNGVVSTFQPINRGFTFHLFRKKAHVSNFKSKSTPHCNVQRPTVLFSKSRLQPYSRIKILNLHQKVMKIHESTPRMQIVAVSLITFDGFRYHIRICILEYMYVRLIRIINQMQFSPL